MGSDGKPRVFGIDPGFSSGGMTYAQRGKVLAAKAYMLQGAAKQKPFKDQARAEGHGSDDLNFHTADLIAHHQATRIFADMQAWAREFGPPTAVAIELFDDQAGRISGKNKGKTQRDRWKTPLVIGHLSALIHAWELQPQIYWQDMWIVTKAKSAELSELARGEDAKLENARLLRNEHVRESWAHADWRLERLKR